MILVPGKGRDVLVELLNQQNVLPSPLEPDSVLFTNPRYVQGKLPTLVQVSVIPMPDTAYEGAVPVTYERMDLTSAFGDIIPRITGLSNGNLWSMLPYIGRELGLQLDRSDFKQVDYSWLGENQEVNIPLVALSSSLSYVGKFVIRFTRRRPNLGEVVVSSDLDVMLHPGQPNLQSSKRLVDMFTYAQDWTEHLESVGKHRLYNIFGNPNGLRTLMSSYGFSNWPVGFPNPISDLATSQVPEANQEYDRVIVQQIADDNPLGLNYVGTAYFHYNLAS